MFTVSIKRLAKNVGERRWSQCQEERIACLYGGVDLWLGDFFVLLSVAAATPFSDYARCWCNMPRTTK
jgi:hypothetical protein